MKFYISTRHILATSILFAAEIAIAYFHFNHFIRGFLGDVLVILLIYCFIKIFIKNHVLQTAVSVLAFAYFVEMLQLFKFAEKLNIHSEILMTIIGSVFDWRDLIVYTLGFLLILLIENIYIKNEDPKNISL
ncbi:MULTISPECIES: DUF2809 domain-containing protein [Aequorivita]|uniref:DUF2809 domain-containing protein n=1 Tax=Aequorivita iocasae TaxID=2803865 RepID=A0ABX7DN96_9FLAO|nr:MULTISPECIES: DUF2809 domain-containing protein [Aequorivita]QQX75509.1 DUF2809 domain-containing protein [Aequorivita iocasae]UCA54963.1 DUF2809 domain-containing protein [Aequorivita sp. F7]